MLCGPSRRDSKSFPGNHAGKPRRIRQYPKSRECFFVDVAGLTVFTVGFSDVCVGTTSNSSGAASAVGSGATEAEGVGTGLGTGDTAAATALFAKPDSAGDDCVDARLKSRNKPMPPRRSVVNATTAIVRRCGVDDCVATGNGVAFPVATSE